MSNSDSLPAGRRLDAAPSPACGRGAPGGERAKPEDLKALAEVRSRTWWLLSRFYLERPEPAFLAELGAAFGSPPTSDAAPDPNVQTLVACLGEGQPADLGRRLGLEFTRLFRGIQEGHGPPPPYESLYRGQSVGGDLTLSVLNRYRAAGFGEVEPSVGPQDHLGAELRFLALLALREAEAWGAGDTDSGLARIGQQQGFMDAHLLTWLPAYVGRIEADAGESFYAAAVRLTLFFAADARSDLDLVEAGLEAA